MPKSLESELVEDQLIDLLAGKGWRFVKADELEREDFKEPLLEKNLFKAIKKINQTSLSDEDINQAINELKFVSTGQEGAKKMLYYLKQGIPIKTKKEKQVVYVKYQIYMEHI